MRFFSITLASALMFAISASAGPGDKRKEQPAPQPWFKVPTPGFEPDPIVEQDTLEHPEADWNNPDDDSDRENNNAINTPRPPSKRAKVVQRNIAWRHAIQAGADEIAGDLMDEEEPLTEDENGGDWHIIQRNPLPAGILDDQNAFFSAGSP